MQAGRPEYPGITKLRAVGHDVRTGAGTLSREPSVSLGPLAGILWALHRAARSVRKKWSARPRRQSKAVRALVDRAAETTGHLARTYFGPEAYVQPVPHVDRETGEPTTILEVHMRCGPDTDLDWLAAQYLAFMEAFVQAVPRGQRRHLVIMAVPADADSV